MLVKCQECGRAISSDSSKCPYCGAPHRKAIGINGAVLAFLGVVAMMLIVGGILYGINLYRDINNPKLKYYSSESQKALNEAWENAQEADFAIIAVGIGLLYWALTSRIKGQLQEEVFLCPHCGEELQEDAVFCPKCGVRVWEDNDNG